MSEETRDPWAIKQMAPDDLVDEYSALVGSIVSRLRRTLAIRVELEDLEAYGIEGLLDAHTRYDPAAGVVFASFAYYRIRGAILDGCRREGWLSRDRSRKARREELVDEYLETSGATAAAAPAPKSFAEALDRVTNVVDDVAMIHLLHEDDGAVLDTSSTQPAQYRRLERRTNRKLLRAALNTLDDEEREVIIRFYFEREKMDDIGAVFGHSRSWVSRVHTRAIESMREYFLTNE